MTLTKLPAILVEADSAAIRLCTDKPYAVEF
jgi:hypothetical protein